MKKYIIFCALCFLVFFPQPLNCQEPASEQRGMFVTVMSDPIVLSTREEIDKLIEFSKKAHIRILFVQIYRANRAWFPSKVGDAAPYEAALKNIGEDPFALLIRKAHSEGIEVHAWLNLLSLSKNEDAPLLKKYGTDILTKNLKEKKRLRDYQIDSQYFLEPGDLRVREELATMVEEILRTYPILDGIQFDYIRYPDKNPSYGFTKINIQRFKKATGIKTIEEKSKAWKDWKREQVSEFLKLLIKRTRAIRPDIQISTTGCMPYVRAYHEAFQDWPGWLNSKLVNFMTIMSYTKTTKEFEADLDDAKKHVENFEKVNIGIGAYELSRSPEIFNEQFRLCKDSGGGACIIFHYGSLLQNPVLANDLEK